MLTDDERKAIIWYWDPVEEAVMIDSEYEAKSDEIKARCTQITNYDWRQLIENPVSGKHIGNDPATNKPAYIDDPEPTQAELLQREKAEKERYLETTNTQTILYLQQLMTPMLMSNDSTSQPVMTAEEYAEMNAKRLEYAERIKEIEAALAG